MTDQWVRELTVHEKGLRELRVKVQYHTQETDTDITLLCLLLS